MAFKIIKKERMTDGYTEANVMEIMIDNQSDVKFLPAECDPGSCCYTADLTYIAMLDVNHKWVKI